jgi:ADP-heptose:LPS heptosyltransferase
MSLRILVVRRDNIGDLVCATPMLAALRERYPDAHIAALVNSYNAGVLSGNPAVDAVHAYTKLKHLDRGQTWLGAILARLTLHRALRRPAFDYVILGKSGFDRYGLAFARRIRPRRIIGFAPADEPAAKAITVPVPPAPYNELHEVEVMMRLAAVLDVRAPPGPLRVYPAAAAVANWKARHPQLGRKERRRWVALHISAREPGRLWPTENWVQLASILAKEHGAGVVLLWSPGAADNPRHPGDDDKAAAIASALEGESLVAARTERLEDLVAVLSLCDAFIGADGGALHIAAGLGLPMVALFENNPYKKKHWYPWKVPHQMVCPATRDIADIAVADVADAWARLP